MPPSFIATPLTHGVRPRAPDAAEHLIQAQRGLQPPATAIEIEPGLVWITSADFPLPPTAGTRVIHTTNGDAVPGTIIAWWDENGYRLVTVQLDHRPTWFKPDWSLVVQACAAEIRPLSKES